MYKKDLAWFACAMSVSGLSTYKEHHVGCVAVRSHRIVSSGYNTCKSDPLQKQVNCLRFVDEEVTCCNHSSHAEVRCLKPLIRTGSDLRKLKIYVARQTRDGYPAIARPCKSCMKVITNLGIRWIYYTGDNSYFREDLSTGEVQELIT